MHWQLAESLGRSYGDPLVEYQTDGMGMEELTR